MSRRKGAWSWIIVAFALLLVGVASLYVLWPKLQPQTTLRLGDGVFQTRVANTQALRLQGLSGTSQLQRDEAMLLVYEREDTWSIWMKDMSYPIDIVWLDHDKKVVHIVKNAPPESYPDETFTPEETALYILELQAGTVEKKSIAIGAEAKFDDIKPEKKQ